MANNLRELRRKKHLTQTDLAKKATVCRTIIARFETGRTGMSAKNLAKVASALGCTIEDILKEAPDGKVAKCG